MKKLFIVAFIFLLTLVSFSQETNKSLSIKRNSIYFEVFGQGLYNAISFDRLYRTDKKIKNSFSAGLTIIPHPELFVLAAPISYNWLFGQKNHHLELGIGFTAMYLRQGRVSSSESYIDQNGNIISNSFMGHSTDFYSFFTPKIGYRFQKPGGGIFFRLTFTPPVAGINRIGTFKGGHNPYDWTRFEYFTNAAFFPYRAFPWAGISIGWTLKK